MAFGMNDLLFHLYIYMLNIERQSKELEDSLGVWGKDS